MSGSEWGQTLEAFKVCLADSKTVTFNNLRTYPPQHRLESFNRSLTPQLARRHNLSYCSDWYVDINVWNKDGILIGKECHVPIASIPTMIRSCDCILSGKKAEGLWPSGFKSLLCQYLLYGITITYCITY